MTHRTFLRIAALLLVGLGLASGTPPIGIAAQQRSQGGPGGRPGQTATRLADGRWLVLGGDGAGPVASIWDPQTQTAKPTPGTPIAARAWHTATLLSDGTVLIVGGGNANGFATSAEL